MANAIILESQRMGAPIAPEDADRMASVMIHRELNPNRRSNNVFDPRAEQAARSAPVEMAPFQRKT